MVRRSRTSCNVATLSSIHGRGGALKTLSRLWRGIPSSDVNPWTFCQECFWYNPAKMPTPAEWVNVRRVRIVEIVWIIGGLGPTAKMEKEKGSMPERTEWPMWATASPPLP